MEFTEPDLKINRTAVFEGPHFSVGDEKAVLNLSRPGEDGEMITSAVVVGGVPVHLYVRDGILRISVHCDGEPVADLLDADGNVRLEITVNDDTVFSPDSGEPDSCRDETGKTVGLVDALISINRFLVDRDLSAPRIQDALSDLYEDSDFHTIRNAWQAEDGTAANDGTAPMHS